MALTVRTDDELDNALGVLSASEGLSRQEIIRRAVLDRYERAGHARRVEEAADRLSQRWADVLERLGNT
jgi:predicted transcriptional regulator